MDCQASVPRDVFPPTPPGPEGSNGNGLLRVQWVSGAWLNVFHRIPIGLRLGGNFHLPVLASSPNNGNDSGAMRVDSRGTVPLRKACASIASAVPASAGAMIVAVDVSSQTQACPVFGSTIKGT